MTNWFVCVEQEKKTDHKEDYRKEESVYLSLWFEFD